MRYDRGYGRDYPMARASGPPRGYDYGLRGYSQTAPMRPPVPLRTYGRGGYDRGYFASAPLPNRVTQRYNREYVHPQPNRLETNYAPYGGDVEGRMVDYTGYQGAYNTMGGSRTWRGGNLPMGWEREPGYGYGGGRYDREFRGYGRDYYGQRR